MSNERQFRTNYQHLEKKSSTNIKKKKIKNLLFNCSGERENDGGAEQFLLGSLASSIQSQSH